MRAMWILSETALQYNLPARFWDHDPKEVTPPGITFLRNADQLYALWFVALQGYIEGMKAEIPFAKQIGPGAAEIQEPVTFQGKAGVSALELTSGWMVVMLAATLEAYLEDILTVAAQCQPVLMAQSPAEYRIPSSLVASAASLTDLHREVACLWARHWLQERKKPTQLLSGLMKLGVGQFRPGLDAQLYRLLGLRHLIVHRSGFVGREFIACHPDAGYQEGDRVLIQDEELRRFIDCTFAAFLPVERHFAPIVIM